MNHSSRPPKQIAEKKGWPSNRLGPKRTAQAGPVVEPPAASGGFEVRPGGEGATYVRGGDRGFLCLRPGPFAGREAFQGCAGGGSGVLVLVPAAAAVVVVVVGFFKTSSIERIFYLVSIF